MPSRPDGVPVQERLARWGYPILLALLLAIFAIQPWAAHLAVGATAVRLAYTLILVGLLVALSGSRRFLALGLIFWFAILALRAMGRAGESDQIWADFLSCVFLWILIGTLLRAVFASEHITLHSVSGAVSAYLLIGISWVLLYQAVDALFSDAFIGLSAEASIRGAQLFYFSFVTLTTLGYGDVAPGRPETFSLAALEAIVGQLYLVVLVAYLVARLVMTRSPNVKS